MAVSVATKGGERIAVVGAGVGGLACAIRLAQSGMAVSVFDPAASAGGLAGGFEVGERSVERFYHHLFRSDTVAREWIENLGLGASLEFLPATMGFLQGGRLYPFGTALSLLRFTPLPPLDRVRLGLRVRALAAEPSPAAFEHVTALDWLKERASASELNRFWHPLLRAKFGDELDKVSMAWLWARFRARVGGSRGGGERLGYLRGGFQQLSEAMARMARELGVELRMSTAVVSVEGDSNGVTGLTFKDGVRESFGGLVWTPSLNTLARAVPWLPDEYRRRCAAVRYHHAVVCVVELRHSVLPFYWVTIGDEDLPFNVAVEHTRLVPASDYGGRTIVYLGRYAAPEESIVGATDDEVRSELLSAAARAFSPEFLDPIAVHVFRAPAAQPLIPPGWDEGRPSLRTGIRGMVAANMAQIYPWDRGINYSIKLGETAAQAMQEELA